MMKFKFAWYIKFLAAGLFSVGVREGEPNSWELHLFVWPSNWICGHEEYEFGIELYGFGPLFLFRVLN